MKRKTNNKKHKPTVKQQTKSNKPRETDYVGCKKAASPNRDSSKSEKRAIVNYWVNAAPAVTISEGGNDVNIMIDYANQAYKTACHIRLASSDRDYGTWWMYDGKTGLRIPLAAKTVNKIFTRANYRSVWCSRTKSNKSGKIKLY